MDATWFAPPAVLVVGAAAIVVLLKRVGTLVDAITVSGRRTRRLEDALVPVHVATRRARRTLDDLDRR